MPFSLSALIPVVRIPLSLCERFFSVSFALFLSLSGFPLLPATDRLSLFSWLDCVAYTLLDLDQSLFLLGLGAVVFRIAGALLYVAGLRARHVWHHPYPSSHPHHRWRLITVTLDGWDGAVDVM